MSSLIPASAPIRGHDASPRGDAGQPSRPARRGIVVIAGLVFASALLVRAVLFSGGLGFQYPDERDYLRIAHSIATSGTFDGGPDKEWPEEFRAPALPYLLGLLMHLNFSIAEIRWLVGVLNALFPVAIFLAARQVTGRMFYAILAASVAVLHPFHARASFALTTDALTATIAAFAMLAFLHDVQYPEWRKWSRPLCGLLLGFAAFFRSNLLLLAIPVLAYWVIQATRGSANRRLLRASTGAIAMAAVILPVAALRSSQEGRLLLITDGGSEILWRGNCEFSLGYLDGTRTAQQYLADYRKTVGQDWGKAAASSRSFAAVRRFVEAEPGAWLRLKLRMLFETWRPWPSFKEDPGVASLAPAARGAVRAAKLAWNLLILVLLLRVLWLLPSLLRRPGAAVFVGFVATATVFGVLLSPDPRYRMPFDAALLLLNLPWSPRRSCESGPSVEGAEP